MLKAIAKHCTLAGLNRIYPKGNPKVFFKKDKPQPQSFNLAQFTDDLAALVQKAIAARIHLVDIDHCLEDRLTAVRFQYAQRSIF
jgi:hypothetical protein